APAIPAVRLRPAQGLRQPRASRGLGRARSLPDAPAQLRAGADVAARIGRHLGFLRTAPDGPEMSGTVTGRWITKIRCAGAFDPPSCSSRTPIRVLSILNECGYGHADTPARPGAQVRRRDRSTTLERDNASTVRLVQGPDLVYDRSDP